MNKIMQKIVDGLFEMDTKKFVSNILWIPPFFIFTLMGLLFGSWWLYNRIELDVFQSNVYMFMYFVVVGFLIWVAFTKFDKCYFWSSMLIIGGVFIADGTSIAVGMGIMLFGMVISLLYATTEEKEKNYKLSKGKKK